MYVFFLRESNGWGTTFTMNSGAQLLLTTMHVRKIGSISSASDPAIFQSFYLVFRFLVFFYVFRFFMDHIGFEGQIYLGQSFYDEKYTKESVNALLFRYF